jgi:hypothetical protein
VESERSQKLGIEPRIKKGKIGWGVGTGWHNAQHTLLLGEWHFVPDGTTKSQTGHKMLGIWLTKIRKEQKQNNWVGIEAPAALLAEDGPILPISPTNSSILMSGRIGPFLLLPSHLKRGV